jgi:hypothetical protein
VVKKSTAKGHKKTGVCNARDPADVRIRDGTKFVRIRDGKTIHIRDEMNIAVGFNQRKKLNHACPGLQPHKKGMWLKPEFPRCMLIRQLKQTAIHEATHSPGKGIKLDIRDGARVSVRDGTFLREKIPKPPDLNRLGEERTYIVNNRKTGLNGGDMEEDGRRLPAGQAGKHEDGSPMEFKTSFGHKLNADITVNAVKSKDGWQTDNVNRHIAVGFNQRREKVLPGNGLQPHQEEMWIEPELPRYILIRQLKQTAIQGTSNGIRQIPEGLHVYRISNPAGLHVYRRMVSRENSTPREVGISTPLQPAGVARPHVRSFFYKHLMPASSSDRPLVAGKTGNDSAGAKVLPSLLADRCTVTLNLAA